LLDLFVALGHLHLIGPVELAGLLQLEEVLLPPSLSFKALRWRFRLVANDFPGIVCILDGD
jgi:hypothetical protein